MKLRIFLLLGLLMAASALPAAAQTSAYLTRSRIANDADFQLRVRFVLIKYAIVVMSEPEATPLAAERRRWSTHILREPDQAAQRTSLGVVTDLSLNANSTDAEIEAVVVSQFNAFAQAFR